MVDVTQALFDALTFVRGGNAQWLNPATGFYEQVGANVGRVEYLPGSSTVKGLLIEPTRTNYWPHFGDLSQGVQQTGSNVTFTPNVAAFPLIPSINYARIDCSGGGINPTTQDFRMATAGLGANLTNSVAFWARSAGAGADQTFRIKNTQSGPADHFSGDLVATSDWQRFDYAVAFTGGGNGPIIGTIAGTQSLAYDIEIAGLQWESGAAAPSSPIITSGSTAARLAEEVYLPTSAFGLNDARVGTLIVDAVVYPTTSAQGDVMAALMQREILPGNIEQGTDNVSLGRRASDLGVWIEADGTFSANGGIAGGNPAAGTRLKAGIAWSPILARYGRTGGTIGEDTTVDPPDMINLNRLWLGAGGGQSPMYITRAQYFPQQASARQLAEELTL